MSDAFGAVIVAGPYANVAAATDALTSAGWGVPDVAEPLEWVERPRGRLHTQSVELGGALPAV